MPLFIAIITSGVALGFLGVMLLGRRSGKAQSSSGDASADSWLWNSTPGADSASADSDGQSCDFSDSGGSDSCGSDGGGSD